MNVVYSTINEQSNRVRLNFLCLFYTIWEQNHCRILWLCYRFFLCALFLGRNSCIRASLWILSMICSNSSRAAAKRPCELVQLPAFTRLASLNPAPLQFFYFMPLFNTFFIHGLVTCKWYALEYFVRFVLCPEAWGRHGPNAQKGRMVRSSVSSQRRMWEERDDTLMLAVSLRIYFCALSIIPSLIFVHTLCISDSCKIYPRLATRDWLMHLFLCLNRSFWLFQK
jgi:hypothetical protein